MTVSTQAVDLVLETTVIDMLGLLTLDWSKLLRWQSHPESFALSDFRRLESLGVDIFHPAVETGAREPREGVDRWLGGWNRLLGRGGPCFLQEVATITDLIAAPRRGRIGVIVGFQNADHLDGPADVRSCFERGQRLSQLTYNERNRLGSGCLAPRDSGLSDRGATVVRAMNDVGMAIDVSHCAERTSLDAATASERPVLITHSNCATLNPGQPRCKSDAVIRAVAAKGGVMGMTVVRAFVKRGRPTLDDLLAHFEHAARLVGVEHVGLGSDVDVDALSPKSGAINPAYSIAGLEPRARVFQIADGLLRRGFAPDHVRGVLGDNFRRALADIWPDDSWRILEERDLRRDPFCPAHFADPPGNPATLEGSSRTSG